MKKVVALWAVMVSLVLSGCSESNFYEQKFLGVNGSPKSIKDTKYDAIEKFGEVIEQDISAHNA